MQKIILKINFCYYIMDSVSNTIMSDRKITLLRICNKIQKYYSLLKLIKLNTFSGNDNSIFENIELCVANYSRGYIIGRSSNLLCKVITDDNSKFLNITINPPDMFNKIYSSIQQKRGLYEIEKNGSVDDKTFFCLTHYIFTSYIFNIISRFEPLMMKFYNKEPRLAYTTKLLSEICKCPIPICEFLFFVITLVLKDNSSINIKNKKICSLYYDKNDIFSTISENEMDVLCSSLLIKNKNTIYILINSIIDFKNDFCNSNLSSDNLIRLCDSGWFELIYISNEIVYYGYNSYDDVMKFFEDSYKDNNPPYIDEFDYDNFDAQQKIKDDEEDIEPLPNLMFQIFDKDYDDDDDDEETIDWKSQYYL